MISQSSIKKIKFFIYNRWGMEKRLLAITKSIIRQKKLYAHINMLILERVRNFSYHFISKMLSKEIFSFFAKNKHITSEKKNKVWLKGNPFWCHPYNIWTLLKKCWHQIQRKDAPERDLIIIYFWWKCISSLFKGPFILKECKTFYL